MQRVAAMLVGGFALFGAPTLAQMPHDHGGYHGAVAETEIPRAPGQDTFSAIAEIVAILESDPQTDWSRVDIGALHRHLLDMDALFTETSVTQSEIAKGLRMAIATNSAGGEAARRMVPAHAPFLERQTGWASTVDVGDDAVVWTVTAATDEEAAKIRALGFYGLMATGAHHRHHHLAIARGEAMH